MFLQPAILSTRSHFCVVGIVVTIASGCVGLNIPSVRYYQPENQQALPTLDQALLFDTRASSSPMDEEHVCCDVVANDDHEEFRVGPGGGWLLQRKQRQVPWPRFHPVPTAPAFQPQGFHQQGLH